MDKTVAIRDLVVNRRARHDFFLEERFEAGVSLRGTEVKSLRAGQANLQEAHVRLRPSGAWLHGCHVAPYEQAGNQNHDPLRPRQLLLRRNELLKLKRGVGQGGLTIVPTRIYLKGSRVKIEIALAKGKKKFDKRQTLKDRSAKKEIRRAR